MTILLVLFFMAAFPAMTYANIGAEWNPTGNPIGGGPGYSDSIRHQDADYVVHDINQFFSALTSANYGDIIYIWDTCHFNMNGHAPKLIPAGVTVASGRGRTLSDSISWGALIYYDDVGANQWEMFRFLNTGKSRVTGLRFRGSYSCLEGRGVGSYFEMPVAAEAAICINKDSCEIDNCEFWGFGYTNVFANAGVGSRLHHNYFHDGNHIYHGYAMSVCGTAENFLIEANYLDYYLSYILGGSGASSINSSYEACWNITGEHADHHSLDRHQGVGSSCAADYIHHNTVRFNGYATTGASAVGICGYPIDSVYIHENWFWDDDSASAISTWSGGAFRIWGNHFTETPPSGLSARMPIANIVASVDSGSVPLTVTFKATGSYDPDGDLRAFYWNFGDSSGTDNYARHTDIGDSVQHTFQEIGVYRVELMVTDNAGIPTFDYVDINVTPTDSRNWLSAWVKDRYHGDRAGYYSVQILIDNWVAWERDIAGDTDWEHVLVDVTDSLVGKDSVTVALRFYCERDTSQFMTIGLLTFWDDITIYGTDIVNANFESGPWSGTAERTDGNWIPSRSTHYYCWDWRASVRSGVGGYCLGRMYNNVATAGDFCQIEQTVAVNGSGIVPGGGGTRTCSLYVPYPNPARAQTHFGYVLNETQRVSLNVYDISGRFIRGLIEGVQVPGEYNITWNGTDESGIDVANGIYFFRVVAGDFRETKQVVWLR
jgi:PKD repeat protein